MSDDNKEKPVNQPIDISAEGLPDAVSNPGRKRLVFVVGVYLLWLLFLVYCIVAGGGTEL